MKVFNNFSKGYWVFLVIFLTFWMGLGGGIMAQRMGGAFAESLLAISLGVVMIVFLGGFLITFSYMYVIGMLDLIKRGKAQRKERKLAHLTNNGNGEFK